MYCLHYVYLNFPFSKLVACKLAPVYLDGTIFETCKDYLLAVGQTQVFEFKKWWLAIGYWIKIMCKVSDGKTFHLAQVYFTSKAKRICWQLRLLLPSNPIMYMSLQHQYTPVPWNNRAPTCVTNIALHPWCLSIYMDVHSYIPNHMMLRTDNMGRKKNIFLNLLKR